MTALDVISLEDAKEFLVVDFPDRDAEITRHIKSAVSIIEQYTDYRLYQRPYSATMPVCGVLEIYDYPIEFADPELRTKYMAMSVKVFAKSGFNILGTVGYSDANNIPSNLIDACYKIITYLFENKDVYGASLPMDVQLLVNQFRRSASL